MTGAAAAWLIAIAFLLAYELFALHTGRMLLTTVVRRSSVLLPLVPFLAGMLAGHFFWCGCP